MLIAPRYVPAACVLLLLALVPTFIHSYSDAVADDGPAASSIPTGLAGFASKPSDRSPTWGMRRFETDDWVEREYVDGSGRERLRLTVVRTYDAKSVYHHPELAVTYGTSFHDEEIRRFDSRPEIPVHVLKPGPGVEAEGLYVLHYDSRFVENPILFQIRLAGELLFTRRKPMTLFFVFDPQGRDPQQIENSASLKLLLSAVDAYVSR
jgi:hypothetical protein